MKTSLTVLTDNLSRQCGQQFTSELEIYFANCNLGHHQKLQLIEFVQRAYEHGKNPNHYQQPERQQRQNESRVL